MPSAPAWRWLEDRAASSLLYGVAATDLRVHGAVVLTLLLVATISALAPARRAARVDPLTALRSE
ncbi:MAG: hypothetical protein U0163_17575 [Gemmatimonadaceae bacterium]